MEEKFRRVPPPPPPRPQPGVGQPQPGQKNEQQIRAGQVPPPPPEQKKKKQLSPALARTLTIIGTVVSFGLCAFFAYMLLS